MNFHSGLAFLGICVGAFLTSLVLCSTVYWWFEMVNKHNPRVQGLTIIVFLCLLIFFIGAYLGI